METDAFLRALASTGVGGGAAGVAVVIGIALYMLCRRRRFGISSQGLVFEPAATPPDGQTARPTLAANLAVPPFVEPVPARARRERKPKGVASAAAEEKSEPESEKSESKTV
jgi:hypothetical protein